MEQTDRGDDPIRVVGGGTTPQGLDQSVLAHTKERAPVHQSGVDEEMKQNLKVDDNNNNEPDNSKLGSDGPSSPGAVANAYLKTSVSQNAQACGLMRSLRRKLDSNLVRTTRTLARQCVKKRQIKDICTWQDVQSLKVPRLP
eukprot:2632832-Amphidinium_carterae.1